MFVSISKVTPKTRFTRFFLLVLNLSIFPVVINSAIAFDNSHDQLDVDISNNLLAATEDAISFLKDPNRFRADNCAESLDQIYTSLNNIGPNYFNNQIVLNYYKTIVQNGFLIRNIIRQRLFEFEQVSNNNPSRACLNSMRNTMRLSRYIDDYVSEYALNPKRFNENTDPAVLSPLKGESPDLVSNTDNKKLVIKSGDIFISRGNVFTSAAIARIGSVDAQFSHIALVYIKNSDGNTEIPIAEAIERDDVIVLEAHIQIGTSIRTLKEYLNDGNARIVQFRYKDSTIAAHAAQFSYNFITQHVSASQKQNKKYAANDPKHNIPYDFQMRLNKPEELFCSEVAYIGYANAGVQIPQYPVETPNTNDLIKRMGITSNSIFAPADMELDTRFEMVFEWKDIRKIQNLRYKDAVLTHMMNLMENEGYKFRPNLLHQFKSHFAWAMRQLEVKKFKTTLPKNMSPKIVSTMLVLEIVAQKMQTELELQEKIYKLNNQGLLMPYKSMLRFLEQYTEYDKNEYLHLDLTAFHWIFRPEGMAP